MNWKRGLTRIYVVIWVLFAAVGLVVVSTTWEDLGAARATVRTFLAAHPGVKLAWLRNMKADSVPYGTDSMTVNFPRGVTVHTTHAELTDVAWAARAADRHLEALGYWLLICGLAPAIILLVAWWIASGFARS